MGKHKNPRKKKEKNDFCINRTWFKHLIRPIVKAYGFETLSDAVYIMYEEERFSTIQIGKMFDMGSTAGLSWVRAVTTPRGRGGNNLIDQKTHNNPDRIKFYLDKLE